jgi:tyrosyl-tRNA synthetase
VKLLAFLGFSESRSDARRLIQQGAIKINGVRQTGTSLSGLKTGDVLQSGKLKFAKLIW